MSDPTEVNIAKVAERAANMFSQQIAQATMDNAMLQEIIAAKDEKINGLEQQVSDLNSELETLRGSKGGK